MLSLCLALASDLAWLERYVQGSRALERGDAAGARIAFEEALTELPTHAGSAYQLACACSREGEVDSAFAALERACALGFDDPRVLAWDEDLLGVRKDARFRSIVDALEAIEVTRRASPPSIVFEGRLGAKQWPPAEWVADARREGVWTVTRDGDVVLVDAWTGRETRRYVRSAPEARALELSRDGRWLAVVSEDGSVVAVDLEVGVVRALPSYPRGSPRTWWHPGLEFADAQHRLAVTGRPGFVRTIDLVRGDVLADVGELAANTGSMDGCAWSADGDRIAVVVDPTTVRVSRVPNVDDAFNLVIERGVECVEFRPGSDELWIGTSRSEVAVYDLATQELVRTISVQALDSLDQVEVGTIQFTSNELTALIASSGWGGVIAYDLDRQRIAWTTVLSENGANPSSFEARDFDEGRRIVTCGQGTNGTNILDGGSGARLHRLESPYMRRIVPIGDGPLLASESRGRVMVLDGRTGEHRFSRSDLEGGEWLLETRSGWIDGTVGALERARVGGDANAEPFEAIAAQYVDAKRARAAAVGVTVAGPRVLARPVLVDRAAPIELIELAAIDPAPDVTVVARCVGGVVGLEVVRFDAEDDRTRTVLAGTGVMESERKFALELDAPAGATTTFRLRALSASGLASPSHSIVVKRARD